MEARATAETQMSNELYILSSGNVFGGTQIFQIKLAVLLRDHIRLVVVSPLLPALKSGLAESGAEFIGLPAHGWLTLRWALLRWLWRQRRVIHASGALMVLNGRGVAYLAPMVRLLTGNAPVIISQTALSMRDGDIKESLYGMAARFARCVVTVSDAIAAQHIQRWPGLAVKSIPNWMDDLESSTALLPQDDLPFSGIIRAAVVARLAPGKGVEDVVAVCAELQGIELHAYGDGPMRDQFDKMGGQFAWLHVHGHVDDLSRRLPAHSILISGSYSESFSYAVAEGIQAGLLCVLTDIPAHRELLGDGYPEGLFFPPGDQAALKHALQTARTLLVNDHGAGARRAVSAAMARIAMRNAPAVARQRYLAVLTDASVGDGVQ